MREIEDMQGKVPGRHDTDNLRCTDATVLIYESHDQPQKLSNKMVEATEPKELTISCKKTDCIIVSKNSTITNASYRLETTLSNKESFKYLRSVLTAYGQCDVEIRRRIGMAKSTFENLRKILKAASNLYIQNVEYSNAMLC